jgi:hypothetical protein
MSTEVTSENAIKAGLNAALTQIETDLKTLDDETKEQIKEIKEGAKEERKRLVNLRRRVKMATTKAGEIPAE